MHDDERPSTKQRSRVARWLGALGFWLGVLAAAITSAALIFGFDLFLRISFHGPHVRSILLIVVGASLVFILLRADWQLVREERRIRRDRERGHE